MTNLWTGKLLTSRNPLFLQFFRNKWMNKIKVDVYPSLQERLEERDETKKNPELYAPVNIGFSLEPRKRKELVYERLKIVKAIKADANLARLSRIGSLKVKLKAVEQCWQTTRAPMHLRVLAEHYGIFSDLFGNAYFLPRVYLHISYEYDESSVSVVYRGNTIKPSEASKQPEVEFASKPDDLWSLILTNPDGNLYENDAECLHWFVGNIPGGDMSKGEVICDYIQPLPPRGTGYHRMVFLLFKQECRIDFSKHQRQAPCDQFRERTFSTLDFYRELQDDITPAGIAWFQSDWDSSIKDVFHKKLNMKEPVYEYDFAKPYLSPQQYFPKKKQFNTYMDRYRDEKEINKEILLKRLKNINPFEEEPPVNRFPAGLPIDLRLSSWLRKEIKKERLGHGKYRDLYRGQNRPYPARRETLTVPKKIKRKVNRKIGYRG